MKIVLRYSKEGIDTARSAIKNADEIVERLVSNRGTDHRCMIILWSHELMISRICQAVRSGVIRTDEIYIEAENGLKIDVDIKGEFIQPWPTDLFELSFHCHFTKYGKVNYENDKSVFSSEF